MSTTACRDCGRAYESEVLDERFGGICPRCLAGFALEERATQVEKEPPPLKPGAVFRGMEALQVLGRGGMGIVYKARQIDLNRPVALKLLAPRLAGDPEFAQRFTREAKVMASLNHPHIVQIYDYGREPFDSAQGRGELYFLAMELVDGVSLRDLMRERRLTPAEALAIVPQICDALAYAHAHGVVHRDIKPENILLDRQGQVKIADFGLAKMSAHETERVTKTNVVMGTPHYMAPEQYESTRDVDHRADIYSLGVVFYEMLTGQVPMGKFEPPSERVEIDVRLDRVVLKALEREPERRYQQASEVKEDVTRVGARPFRRRRKGRLVSLIAIASLLACAGAALTVYLDRKEKLERNRRIERDRHLVDGDRALELEDWGLALLHYTQAQRLGSAVVSEEKIQLLTKQYSYCRMAESLRSDVERLRNAGMDTASQEHRIRLLDWENRKRADELRRREARHPTLEDFVLEPGQVPKGLKVHGASFPAILSDWRLILKLRSALPWLEEEDLKGVVRAYHGSFEPGDFGFVVLEFLDSADVTEFSERERNRRRWDLPLLPFYTNAGIAGNLVLQEYHGPGRADQLGPRLLRRWLASIQGTPEKPTRTPRVEDYLLLESELPASIRFSAKPEGFASNPFLATDADGVPAIQRGIPLRNVTFDEIRRGYVAYLEDAVGSRLCFWMLELADNDVLVRLAEQTSGEGCSWYADRIMAHLFRLAEGAPTRGYEHLANVISRKHRVAHGERVTSLQDLRFHLQEAPPTFMRVGGEEYVAHQDKPEGCCGKLKDPPVHRDHDVSCRWRLRRENREYVISGYQPWGDQENPKLQDALAQATSGSAARTIFSDEVNIVIEGSDLEVLRQLEEWLRRRLGLSPGRADAVFASAPDAEVREWGNWLVAESGNFAVFLEKGGPEDRRIVRDLRDKLEIFRGSYESLVKVPAKLDPKPLVRIYSDRTTFERREGTPGAACFYNPRSKELVGTTDGVPYSDLVGFLSHEALHLFLAYTLPDFEQIPPWLSEGVAIGFASHEIRDGKLVPFLLEGEARLRVPVAASASVPLKDLLGMNRSGFYRDAAPSCAAAWSFCHFLWNSAHREKILKLFAGMQAGKSWRGVYDEVFADVDLARLEEEWKEFLRKP